MAQLRSDTVIARTDGSGVRNLNTYLDKVDAATSAATPNTIVQRDPAGRFKAAAPAAADDAARKAEVDAVQSNLTNHIADYVRQPGYGVATGSANAYAVTLSPAPPAYVDGMAIALKINEDNTGPATLNVNDLGPKPIKRPNGNDVAPGNLKAGSVYTLRFNGANFILQGEGGSGNAQPSDVLSGKTFTNDQGEQVGTMPNRGGIIITPGTTDQPIPLGFHDGTGKVVGDPDLIPQNIRAGVDIFGVIGSLVPAQIATGQTTITSSLLAFPYQDSSGNPVNKSTFFLEVTGLAFTPDFIFAKATNGSRWILYFVHGVMGGFGTTFQVLAGSSYSYSPFPEFRAFGLGSNGYVNLGFRLPLLNSDVLATFDWYAYKFS